MPSVGTEMEVPVTTIGGRLQGIANQLAYAIDVKEAARLRRQCYLEEWYFVLAEAKNIYARRKKN